MAKRLGIAGLFGIVACGLIFYLAYFLGLIYFAVSGPLNPVNARPLEAGLRHFALPLSVGLGLFAFGFVFWRLGQRPAEDRRAKVIAMRKVR